MKYCGKHVFLRPSSSDIKGLWNLSVGDYTSIPKGSVLYCTEAPLTIGKKVIFGPHPTIITGDHRIDVIGKFIMDSEVKLPENDAPVVIEVSGYADKATGTKARNLYLSEKRAEVVKAALVNLGIEESRIQTKYYGSDVNPFDTPAENRVAVCVASLEN